MVSIVEPDQVESITVSTTSHTGAETESGAAMPLLNVCQALENATFPPFAILLSSAVQTVPEFRTVDQPTKRCIWQITTETHHGQEETTGSRS